MALNADEIAGYILKLEAENRMLKEVASRSIDPIKFYAGKLDIPETARLHGVDPRTVRYYIQKGLIPKHPDSTDAHTYLRGSDAVAFDNRLLKQIDKQQRS